MKYPDTALAFFDRLISGVPEIGAVRDEFIREFDEVIPHILMADIRRFVAERAQDARFVDAVLGYLEEGMGSQDEYVVELISASFLENMDPSEPSYDALSSRMGPRLRAQLARSRVLWE
jgi:hypothetical protein